MIDSFPKPIWRCIRVEIGHGSDVNMNDILDETCGVAAEIAQSPEAAYQLVNLKQPTGQELAAEIQAQQAAFVYVHDQNCFLTPDQIPNLQDLSLLEAFARFVKSKDAGHSAPQILYVDAALPEATVEELAKAGIQYIVYWSEERPGSQLIAAHFGHAFCAALRNPVTTVPEAFAVASHACHVHLGSKSGPGQAPAALPCLRSAQTPALPSNNSVPLPQLEGMDLSQGIAAVVPDWDSVRLLAPHAELRLLACGQASLIAPHRLSFLGEALRAMLVLEVRQLTVTSQTPTHRVPAHLPAGCTALRCEIQSASGGCAKVVLGGPQEVLKNPALVEHALRQTLSADALSLQFKLPPPSLPVPIAQSSDDIAGGTPLVDALAVTSVWVVQLLRMLCSDSKFRMLAALGIAAVGCTTTSSFTQSDAGRFTALTHLTSAVPESLDPILLPSSWPAPAPLGPIAYNTLPAQQHPSSGSVQMDGQRSSSQAAAGNTTSTGSRGRPAKEPKLAVPELASVSWSSDRPELSVCTPHQLLEDMRGFLEVRRGRQLQSSTFPEAILNGSQLDLNALYRAVCSRGGYGMGSGVNWAGQVFPRMANFTNTHKMTGVGNALKRHYQALCLDYELAHPEDLDKQEASG
ncbi:hypothetical protein WJX79_002219 [Trebouxia sp. C0005]